MESGSCDFALSRNAAAQDGRAFAAAMGCASDDDEETTSLAAEAACLRTLSADDLTFPNENTSAPWPNASSCESPGFQGKSSSLDISTGLKQSSLLIFFLL